MSLFRPISFVLTAALVAGCAGADPTPADDGSSNNGVDANNGVDSNNGAVETANNGANNGANNAANNAPELDMGGPLDPDVAAPEPTGFASTALVVEADRVAGSSQYGFVTVENIEGEAPTVSVSAPTEFGTGHVHVNNSGRGTFVMDTQRGTVRVIDTSITPPRVVADVSLQAASAPDFDALPQWVGEHAASGTIIVSQFGRGSIAQVPIDWETGDVGPILQVDLSNYDDDGSPDPTIVLIDGDYALVALQRLGAGWTPSEDKNSQMLVWHVPTGTTAAIVDLPGKHFYAGMKWGFEGDVYAGLAGMVGTADAPIMDGGIARINRLDEGSYVADERFVITEETLGGDLWGFVMTSPTTGYAVVQADGRQLIEFDTEDEIPTRALAGVSTPNGWIELAGEGQLLWIADLGGEAAVTAGMRVRDLTMDGMLSHDKLGFDGRPTSFAITGFELR